MNVIQIKATKDLDLKSFREHIKQAQILASFKGQTLNTAFIFSDDDIVHEDFLDDI